MRIYIREKGGKGFGIPVPLWIIRAGMSKAVIKAATRKVPEEQRKYIDAIDFGALSHCLGDLKNYKGLELVNVKSKDGDEVSIII